MQRNLKLTLAIYFIGLCASCSNLKNSEVQQVTNMSGSYFCPVIKFPTSQKETLAEEDVSRIRCYQDEWFIDKNGPSLHRILFQGIHCNKPLGKIEATLNRTPVHCTFIKDNPNWLAEENGRCVLSNVPVHQKFSIDALKACPKAVPEYCNRARTSITITARTAQSITVSQNQGSKQQICDRNPQ